MHHVPSFLRVQNIKSTQGCGKEVPVEFPYPHKFLLPQSSTFPLPGQPLTGAGVFSDNARVLPITDNSDNTRVLCWWLSSSLGPAWWFCTESWKSHHQPVYCCFLAAHIHPEEQQALLQWVRPSHGLLWPASLPLAVPSRDCLRECSRTEPTGLACSIQCKHHLQLFVAQSLSVLNNQ